MSAEEAEQQVKEGASSGGSVKWLYPGADQTSDRMEADKVKEGKDSKEHPEPKEEGKMDKEASKEQIDEKDASTPVDPNETGEYLGKRVSASASYLGSVFSSAWNKTAKTANDATASGSSLISSAFTKVSGGGVATNVEGQEGVEKKGEQSSSMTASSLLSSALGGLGLAGGKVEGAEEDKQGGDANAASLTGAFNSLSKAAVGATKTIKEKVGTANVIAEFNKEQASFIKSKGSASRDVGLAPWVGYRGEEELRAKIIGLSEDKRNFVRAPPSGVSFDFDYAAVAPVAMALLQEDPRLDKMRYDLVPKKVKEEEFWRNYFYRVGLIKQSFELKDLEQEGEGKVESKLKPQTKTATKAKHESLGDDVEVNADDDDFVSDSYQASTSDLAEADETMKKLGVGSTSGSGEADAAETDEWEAELEGELNEYEVVAGGKDGAGDVNNPEWENQIQEMLDAEESLSK